MKHDLGSWAIQKMTQWHHQHLYTDQGWLGYYDQ
jgi:hypothetical protein